MANVSVLNTTGQLSAKTLCVAENDQTISGAWTFTGNQLFNGNVTLGNAVGDTLTVTATIISNLIFTDATYDIGASGATRPRDFFLSRDAVLGGDLSVGGGDLIATANLVIRRNTSDAADSGAVTMAGGGAWVAGTASRGAAITVYGNEHAEVGSIINEIGNVTGAIWRVDRSNGTAAAQVNGSDGSATFTSNKSTGAGWTFAGASGASVQLPTMTTTVRDGMTAVAGMIIYNSTTATIQGYQGGVWTNL